MVWEANGVTACRVRHSDSDGYRQGGGQKAASSQGLGRFLMGLLFPPNLGSGLGDDLEARKIDYTFREEKHNG